MNERVPSNFFFLWTCVSNICLLCPLFIHIEEKDFDLSYIFLVVLSIIFLHVVLDVFLINLGRVVLECHRHRRRRRLRHHHQDPYNHQTST